MGRRGENVKIKPLIDTGKTPHLTLGLIQTFGEEREPEIILPLFTGERITNLLISNEIKELKARVNRGYEFLERCVKSKAPESIGKMRLESINEDIADIETCEMLIETVKKSWHEMAIELQLLKDELDDLGGEEDA